MGFASEREGRRRVGSASKDGGKVIASSRYFSGGHAAGEGEAETVGVAVVADADGVASEEAAVEEAAEVPGVGVAVSSMVFSSPWPLV